ncbi:MAG TPA: metalloregulator ArsR/SmtB family transcription factor [Clostridia bacterium]|nr:metalloregulator ArsR/SmtB family transcription factor [Clostridia bacterium]
MKAATDELSLELRAVGDPARREILKMLNENKQRLLRKPAELCAGDIEQRLGLAQPTISHHMRVLRHAGLVDARKVGTFMWYRRNEAALRKMRRELAAV